MATAPHPPMAIASDLVAFHETINLPLCGRLILFPTMSMRWGLAAMGGAHHLWHIDCDGFATYIDTQTGYKLWIVAQPKHGSNFSNISLFTSSFEVNGTNQHLWTLEAIPLFPGS